MEAKEREFNISGYSHLEILLYLVISIYYNFATHLKFLGEISHYFSMHPTWQFIYSNVTSISLQTVGFTYYNYKDQIFVLPH